MESSFLISTAISRLQGFTNDLKRVKPSYVPYVTGYERALTDLVTMLSVFAPLFGAQLRQALGKPPVAVRKSSLAHHHLPPPAPISHIIMHRKGGS